MFFGRVRRVEWSVWAAIGIASDSGIPPKAPPVAFGVAFNRLMVSAMRRSQPGPIKWDLKHRVTNLTHKKNTQHASWRKVSVPPQKKRLWSKADDRGIEMDRGAHRNSAPAGARWRWGRAHWTPGAAPLRGGRRPWRGGTLRRGTGQRNGNGRDSCAMMKEGITQMRLITFDGGYVRRVRQGNSWQQKPPVPKPWLRKKKDHKAQLHQKKLVPDY